MCVAVRSAAMPFALFLGAGGPLAVQIYYDQVGNYDGAFYAVAPLVISRDGVQQLKTTDLVVGLIPSAQYRNQRVTLAADLGPEGAPDATVGAGGLHRPGRHAELDEGVLLQRRRRAGLHARAARDALGGQEVRAAGGFHQLAQITDITDEEWDRVITLNLKTCFLCSRAVAGIMMERRKGRIVNIASGSGIAPNPFAPTYLPYGAAKAGVINMTKILGRDLGPYGITVNAISPGTTATPRVVKVRDEASRKKIAEQNPMRCLVEPQDSAEAALFLASPEARYITGVNLNVNAGNLM